MTIQQAAVWIQVGQVLVTSGIATVNTIKGWIAGQHPGMTDADMNAILDAIIAAATKQKALADLDAGGAKA